MDIFKMQIQEINSAEWSPIAKDLARDIFFQQSDWLKLVSGEFGLINKFVKISTGNLEVFFPIQIKAGSAYSNFIGYGGPITTTPLAPEIMGEIIKSIEDFFQVHFERIKLFPGSSLKFPSPQWTVDFASVVNISPDWRELLDKETRYAINYALRHNVEVKKINSSHLSEFYALYLETMTRVNSLYVTPKSLFEQLIHFPNVDFMGAFIDGRLEAVCVYMKQGRWSYYWWNVSSIVGRKQNANYLIMSLAIDRLLEEGIEFLDMASSHTENIGAFKARWGAQPIPFSLYTKN